jgi:ketosteroid isomerase-like protein
MTESAEDGIKQQYRTYVETFNREDAAGVSQLLAYPAMMGGPGHPPISMPDAASFERMIAGTFAAFKEKGWVRSQIDSMEAVATAGDNGVLAATFSRYRADGSLLEADRGHYIMTRRDGRWWIIGAIVG